LECSSKCQPRARAAIGIEPLQLVIVHDTKRDTAHAVVAVRLDERWLTLDNRMLVMVNTIETGCYPLFVLDGVCGRLAPRPFTAQSICSSISATLVEPGHPPSSARAIRHLRWHQIAGSRAAGASTHSETLQCKSVGALLAFDGFF
jgi:hypothetical protein